MSNLIYYQVGDNIPNYMFDSIYQVLLINNKFQTNINPLTIYIITNEKWIDYIKARINKMDTVGNINIIAIETLEETEIIKDYKKITMTWNKQHIDFRGGFWLHTTNRFLYIAAFMDKFKEIKNVFHIESDIMIYENLNNLYEKLEELKMTNKIIAVQDAPNRAICSIVFIPHSKSAIEYSKYIINKLKKSGQFLNDMDLMGTYTNKYELPDSPNHPLAKTLGVFDACAIGQYLGGIDFKNIPQSNILNQFVNPTRGFINETAVFKANTCKYSSILSKDGKKYKMYTENQEYNINALHIHSKQLYLFSSKFDIEFYDILSGDRIVSMCHFVFCDQNQFNYNTNLMTLNRNVFLIKNFNNINFESMNDFLNEFSKQTGITTFRLFVFIDNMLGFTKMILPNLSDKYEYEIYSHNGDYAFDYNYLDLLKDKKIKKIFAQNLDIDKNIQTDKLTLLPIGIAREVFPHGDLNCLYSIMFNTYMNKKNKSIYINLNASTHYLRKQILEKIYESKSKNENNWELVSAPKPYKEYLLDLSQHRFALCIRGNGIDTHRFWECLYLRVIPVLVYDDSLVNYLFYLDKLRVPYFIVKSPDFFNIENQNFFDENLYNTFDLNNCEYLKLKNYFS